MIAAALIAIGVLAPIAARAELWRACIPARVSAREALRWTAGGFALNQALGFRSGDVLRVAMVRRRCGLAAGASSVVLFRAVELAVLASVAAVAAVAHGLGGGACGLVALASLAALVAAPRAARRWAGNHALVAPLARLDAHSLSKCAALAVLAYAAEAALFVGVAELLGAPLSWSEAVLLVVASTLGQVAAFLPANLVTYEASVGGAMAAFGIASAALWQLPLLTHAAKLALSVCLLPVFLDQSRRATT